MKFLLSVLLLTSLNAMAAQTKALPKKATKAPASVDAATTTTAPAVENTSALQTSTTSVAVSNNWAMQRLSVGALISQADTFKGATITNGIQKADADINSSTAMGFTAQLAEYAKWNNVGWYAAATMEQTREFSTLKIEGASVSIAQKPSYRPWIANAGANYQFNSNVYAFGGLNYTLYSEKNSGLFGSFEMNPELGYQYGAGLNIKKVSFELSIREVAYNISARKENLKLEGRSTLTGMNLQARYNF